jgi:hypothetical protein
MKSARFPYAPRSGRFDFAVSQVDQRLIKKAGLSFTQDAQNVVLVGGPGTGTHLATALGISLDPARQAGALHRRSTWSMHLSRRSTQGAGVLR